MAIWHLAAVADKLGVFRSPHKHPLACYLYSVLSLGLIIFQARHHHDTGAGNPALRGRFSG